MNTALSALYWLSIGFISLVWLYVAARVVTRAVLRTIRRREQDRE
jgi:hypothetical protein